MNFADIKSWRIPEGEVIQVVDSQNRVIWKKETGPDYTEPFYVENITNENETLRIVKNESFAPTRTIEYSADKATWNTLGPTSTDLTRTLAPGDKVYLRCNANTWGNDYYYNKILGISKVGGNIMSLLYGSNFTGQETDFPNGSTYNFTSLFYNNTNLVDASKLLLSATTLTYCCYYFMFDGCTSLTQAPVLNATTLAYSCCFSMFKNCTSLTTAPVLNATTLVASCYNNMFAGCTSLSNVTCLATSGIDEYTSVYAWLQDVSSTGTFTKAAGATWPTGENGIPSGWTVVEV